MKNLYVRALAGIVYVVSLVCCTLWNPISLLFFFALVAGMSSWEFVANVNRHAGTSINPLISTTASVLLVVAMFDYTFANSVMLFYAYVLTLLYLLIAELYRKETNALGNWAFAFAAQLYVALPFSLIFPLSQHHDIALGKISAEGWLPLSVFIFLWISDSGAYLVGSTLGRFFPAKLFPRISPNKSWIGSLGGALLCIVAAILLHEFVGLHLLLWQWIGLSLVVCIFGTWGDLVESLFKRQLGIKDSGNILPGHGGMLDRFDSALLAIPAAFCFLRLCTM